MVICGPKTKGVSFFVCFGSSKSSTKAESLLVLLLKVGVRGGVTKHKEGGEMEALEFFFDTTTPILNAVYNLKKFKKLGSVLVCFFFFVFKNFVSAPIVKHISAHNWKFNRKTFKITRIK